MKFALIPLAIAMASASPVWNNVKRQEPSAAVSSAASAASSAVSSAASVASSAATSAAATATSAASSAAASASASAVPGYDLAYPCPAGTELVYVEEQANVPGVTVEQATPLLAFSAETWYATIVNSTGNDIGATRFIQFPGLPIDIGEVLVNQTSIDGVLQQVINGTTPINAGGIQLAAYSTVLQAYQNDTDPSALTAKAFTNACVSPRSVQDTLAQLFQAALAQLAAAATGATPSSAAPSGPVSAPISAPVAPSASAPVASVSAAVSEAMSMSMPMPSA